MAMSLGRLRILWVVCIPALAHCGGGDGEGGTNDEEIVVTSADGRLTLTIPAGAADRALAADDVEIVPIPAADFTVEGATSLGSYRFLPDGVQFSEPALLQWRLTADEASGSVTFVHSSEDSVAILPVAETVADDAGDTVTVSLEIPHFSEQHTLRVQVLDFDPQWFDDEAPVGGHIAGTWRLAILEDTDSYSVVGQWGDTIVASWSGVTSGSGWSATLTAKRIGTILSPELVRDEAGPEAANYFDLSFSFVCESAGTNLLEVEGYPLFPCRVQKLRDSSTVSDEMTDCWSWYRSTRVVNCTAATEDETGVFIDSISSQAATFTSNAIDIVSSWASSSTVTQSQADALKNNSLFECGDDGAESGRLVVCPDNPVPLGEGDLLTATTNLVDAVPTGDTGHAYIYALVLDSDGDPANDWQFVPPYDWDLFRGTDRWYQLIWNHQTQQWSMTVTQVQSDQSTVSVSSGAWAVIEGSHINFYVPGTEYDATAASYRVTAFGHDGSFSPSDRGADVSGANPEDPLLSIDGG